MDIKLVLISAIKTCITDTNSQIYDYYAGKLNAYLDLYNFLFHKNYELCRYDDEKKMWKINKIVINTFF